MDSSKLAPVCGTYCGHCGFFGKQCKGCGHVDGRPFWTAQLPAGACPLYDCCRNEKQKQHCGLCEEFPCEQFLTLRDPTLSDVEFEKSLQARRAALKRRTEIGTEGWLLEISGKKQRS